MCWMIHGAYGRPWPARSLNFFLLGHRSVECRPHYTLDGKEEWKGKGIPRLSHARINHWELEWWSPYWETLTKQIKTLIERRILLISFPMFTLAIRLLFASAWSLFWPKGVSLLASPRLILRSWDLLDHGLSRASSWMGRIQATQGSSTREEAFDLVPRK